VQQDGKSTLRAYYGMLEASFISYEQAPAKPEMVRVGGTDVALADMELMAVMKAAAVHDRGAKRDFVDIHAICGQPGWSVSRFIAQAVRHLPLEPEQGWARADLLRGRRAGALARWLQGPMGEGQEGAVPGRPGLGANTRSRPGPLTAGARLQSGSTPPVREQKTPSCIFGARDHRRAPSASEISRVDAPRMSPRSRPATPPRCRSQSWTDYSRVLRVLAVDLLEGPTVAQTLEVRSGDAGPVKVARAEAAPSAQGAEGRSILSARQEATLGSQPKTHEISRKQHACRGGP
jgi:hypothetical protein